MKIAIASDHAGVTLKEQVAALLEGRGVEVSDLGTRSDESVDYPDYGEKVARAVSAREVDCGVLICGTGIGMSIVANKFPGVRAALCHDRRTAEISRQHNDANILVMGARVLDPGLALQMVEAWLATPFEGGRHQRRVDKIGEIEKGNGTGGMH
jgi:ribose 5-phosphate isomerase B